MITIWLNLLNTCDCSRNPSIDTRYRFEVAEAKQGGPIVITSSNGGAASTSVTTRLNVIPKAVLPPKIEFNLPSAKGKSVLSIYGV